ncbi:MAG: hypothetical protein M3516_10080 [Actinomycetota bacterium]|nr:hypothetical protein [Actinomycetota bacterium]
MAFSTIEIASGLSKSQHRRAALRGPRAVVSTRPAGRLMSAAHFTEVRLTDVTDDFLRTARAWSTEFDRHESELKRVLGAQNWEDRQADRAAMIDAVEAGLLCRYVVTGTAR